MDEIIRKELFTVAEVAKITNVAVSTVWRNVKSGRFPTPIKVCGSTRWRRADIEALISDDAVQSAA